MSSDQLDGLTPTGYLILDVLAARYRLGEDSWHFPNQVSVALGRLSRKDYLNFKDATIQGYQQAWLTEKGANFLNLDRPFVIRGKQQGRVWGECNGLETVPNLCRCSCYPCKHHCAAHEASSS